jgi:hypothetical protein
MSILSSLGSLTKLPLTGLGDIVKGGCDAVLPKELKFVGDVLAGAVDLETGNPIGALRHGIDLLKDLKDLPQTPLNAPGPDRNAPGHTWCYEPTPPTCCTSRNAGGEGWQHPLPATYGPPAGMRERPPAQTPVTVGPNPTVNTGASSSEFFKLSDGDFMKALRDGKIPSEVTDSKEGMLQVQTRMNHITEMNQLMTSMLQALHQMSMSVIQNVRA